MQANSVPDLPQRQKTQQKTVMKRLTEKNRKSKNNKLGIFYLVCFFILGIFSPSLQAVQTIHLDVPALSTYAATFSFDTGEIAKRATYPDRAYFNSSGTINTIGAISAYSTDFSPWLTNYSSNAWSFSKSGGGAPNFFEFSMQAKQVRPSSSYGISDGSFIISRMKLTAAHEIELLAYSNEANLLSTVTAGFPKLLSTNNLSKPHAMVETLSGLYFFWVAQDNKIHYNKYSGTFGSEITLTNTDTDSSFGVSGCRINSGTDTYVAFTYPKSASEVNIVTFKENDFPNTATTTISLSNISSSQVAISQNPRTGIIYLSWINGATAYYMPCTFTAPTTFSGGTATAITSTWQSTYGVGVQGYDNFETNFSLPSPSAGDNTIKDILLKNTTSIHESFSPYNGYSCIFPCTISGKQYAGMVILSGFTEFRFYKKELKFPANLSWKKSDKVLHLEGPPIQGTNVSIEADFAELATSSCIAQTINSAGGRSAFQSSTGVIASSGNLITIKFDKAMNQASYTTLVNNKVKVFAPDNTAIPLTYDSGTSTEFNFRINSELLLETNYRLSLASDVFDSIGSQLWAPATITFQTQKAQSGVIASEVQDLFMYKDPARTIAINNLDEINATSTIYFKLKSIDPAFNTVDLATLSLYLDGVFQQNLSAVQPTANSTDFLTSTSISSLWSGSHTYEIRTASTTVYKQCRVNFPTLTSVNPLNTANGVTINTTPQIVFSENLSPTSVTTSTVRLLWGATPASYTISVSGNTITINPDDSSEGYLFPDSTYQIQFGYGIQDLKGNPYFNNPATYTSSFSTQASQTRPISISNVSLYSDSGFSSLLPHNEDFSATGTIYIKMTGVDGSSLTRDYAIASISTGLTVNLTETASFTGVFRGSYSFNSLPDRFNLKVDSAKTPTSSASLLITYPRATPISPASAATNVPVNSTITIQADEAINPASINSTNLKLTLNGTSVDVNRSYNAITRQITLSPTSLMQSEKTYVVTVSGLLDSKGNPQLSPLIYSFKIEDIIPPTLTGNYPANGASNVTIDQRISLSFSEDMLASSATPGTIKITRNGLPASYTAIVSGNKITIDPDDSSESLLTTESTYVCQVGPSVTDLAGNGLSNVPATFTFSFSTQPAITQPSSLVSINLYRDALYTDGFAAMESIPATSTIYIKTTGVDGATQTQDLATISLSLSWGPLYKIALQETASNSSGLFTGSFNLNSLPVYGYPTPQPPLSIATISVFPEITPSKIATLTLGFPSVDHPKTLVQGISGVSNASGAINVRVDSNITTAFNIPLSSPGSSTSFIVASGATPISGSRLLSTDKKSITFTPSSSLPYSSKISVSGKYANDGLTSTTGNPLFRDFLFSFTTQAAQTPPSAISQFKIYSSPTYNALSELNTNSDFPGSGTIYLEITGTDLAPNTIDSTIASISTGVNIQLMETGFNTGLFRGSYNYSPLGNGFKLIASSKTNPAASQTLLLSYPSLSQSIPASGATNVSINTAIELLADEQLNASTVSTSSIQLIKSGGSSIPINVAYNATGKKIVITPMSPLEYATDYFIRASNIRDEIGNTTLTTYLSTFKTQITSVPPVTVNSIRLFSNSAFTTELANNDMIAPSSEIFVQISAVDLSNVTNDSTKITISSDKTAASFTVTLVETGVNTGIFRGSKEVFSDESASILFSSLTNPTINKSLKTFYYPKVTSISPASGSLNLYLNNEFTLGFNKNISAPTISTSSIKLISNGNLASYTLTQTAPTSIKIMSELEPSAIVILQIEPILKDTDNLPLQNFTASFTTLTPTFSTLELFKDAARTQSIASGSSIEQNTIIYTLLSGSDSFFNKTETTPVKFSTIASTSLFTCTEGLAGKFAGQFIAPSQEGLLRIIPEKAPWLESQLNILPAFSVLSFTPASGSTGVAADTWPSWNFSRPVSPSDVSLSNFKLIKVSTGLEVPSTISTSPSGKQIRIQPNNILSLVSLYEMRVPATIKDTAGNLLGKTIISRFETQPPPPPPTIISKLANFETSNYATSTLAVATNGTLYLELVANDLSFSTIDTAKLRIDSSDGTIDGLELVMVETDPPSGIYRYALPVNLPVGTTIKVQSQVNTTFNLNIVVSNRTKITSVNPASGSTNLFLDKPIELTFSQPINPSTLQLGLTSQSQNSSSPTLLDFSTTNLNKTISVSPKFGWATGTINRISINTSLHDSNGLFLNPESLSFSTLSITSASMEIYTGLSPESLKPISQTMEAAAGNIEILATTTNAFETRAETRTVAISIGTSSYQIVLPEVAGFPGSFKNSFSLPGSYSENATATLQFFTTPSLSFKIASLPNLLGIFPATGATNVSDVTSIVASFSRKMSAKTANNAVSVSHSQGVTNFNLSLNSTDSYNLAWNPAKALPANASCTILFSGLTDYLGQPLNPAPRIFSTGGQQGINLYTDSDFLLPITGDTLTQNTIYVEVSASNTAQLDSSISYSLNIKQAATSTQTASLKLEPAATGSGKFRCQFNISPTKAIPQHPLSLNPGEWIELSAPQLSNDQKKYFYKLSNSASPQKILGVNLFSEKNFAKPVSGRLLNPSLFIEIVAEDLNWYTQDNTVVWIYSESDRAGFKTRAYEIAAHSNSFRTFVTINSEFSRASSGQLKALPGETIYIVSDKDPSIKTSIKYLPENRLDNVFVYPSPARGNQVTFTYYLNFPGNLELRVFDTAGDQVYGKYLRGQEGENRHTWRIPSRIANGVYFFKISLESDAAYPTTRKRAKGKFAVLR